MRREPIPGWIRSSHSAIATRISAALCGDVGGFGAGASIDWQALATVDYAPTPGTDVHLGFRALKFEYSAEKEHFNTHTCTARFSP